MACARSCVQVVLPLVPVTPITKSAREGAPKKRSAITPTARRRSATAKAGTGASRRAKPSPASYTTAAAPEAMASPMNARPSATMPGSARKRSPAPTRRLSSARPCTARSCSAGTSAIPSSSVRRRAVGTTRVILRLPRFSRSGSGAVPRVGRRAGCRGDEAPAITCANTGAATSPPKYPPARGSSSNTTITSRGCEAGAKPANQAR